MYVELATGVPAKVNCWLDCDDVNSPYTLAIVPVPPTILHDMLGGLLVDVATVLTVAVAFAACPVPLDVMVNLKELP